MDTDAAGSGSQRNVKFAVLSDLGDLRKEDKLGSYFPNI